MRGISCYLLVWLVERDGSMAVESAGFYSEPPWSITHELHATQPAIVHETHGFSYHDAVCAMEDYAQGEIEFHEKHGIKSVHGQILKLAMESRQ